jgi:hypothetical protein
MYRFKCTAAVYDHRERTCDLFAVNGGVCRGTPSTQFSPVVFPGADYFE